jgi:hypothetical protein
MVTAAGGDIREPRGVIGTPEKGLAMAACAGSEMRYLVITFLVAGLCAGVLGISLGIMAIRSPPTKEQQATRFEERLPRVMIAPKVVTPQVVTQPELAPAAQHHMTPPQRLP